MITLQDFIEIQEAKRILSNPNYEIIDEGKVGRAIKKFFNWLFGSSKTNSHISKIDLDNYNVNDDGIIQLKLSDFIIEDQLDFAQIQNTITDVDNNEKDDDSKKFHHIKKYIKDIKAHKYGIYENMVHGYTLRPNNQLNIAGLIIFSYADDLYNETYADDKNSSPRYKLDDIDADEHKNYGHIWDVEIVPKFDNSKKDKSNNLFKKLVNYVNDKLRNAGNEGVTTIANYSEAGKYWKENHGFKPYKSADKSYYEKEL